MAREKGKGRARLQERRAFAQLVERSQPAPPPLTRQEQQAEATAAQLIEAYLPRQKEGKNHEP